MEKSCLLCHIRAAFYSALRYFCPSFRRHHKMTRFPPDPFYHSLPYTLFSLAQVLLIVCFCCIARNFFLCNTNCIIDVLIILLLYTSVYSTVGCMDLHLVLHSPVAYLYHSYIYSMSSLIMKYQVHYKNVSTKVTHSNISQLNP